MCEIWREVREQGGGEEMRRGKSIAGKKMRKREGGRERERELE